MAKLYFRYAAMNAGKSTALLQVAYNYAERGMKVMIFTAALDHRSGFGYVRSRLGIKHEAALFGADSLFSRRNLPADLACILIDEAQFLSITQVQQLHRLAHLDDLPVICYGLRSDFKGDGFAGSLALLSLADDLEEMKTICACGRKASMNMRIDDQGHRVREGLQIEIGGNERYRAVCPKCFYADDDAAPEQAPGLFG
jgi:thymidine kinase